MSNETKPTAACDACEHKTGCHSSAWNKGREGQLWPAARGREITIVHTCGVCVVWSLTPVGRHYGGPAPEDCPRAYSPVHASAWVCVPCIKNGNPLMVDC